MCKKTKEMCKITHFYSLFLTENRVIIVSKIYYNKCAILHI